MSNDELFEINSINESNIINDQESLSGLDELFFEQFSYEFSRYDRNDNPNYNFVNNIPDLVKNCHYLSSGSDEHFAVQNTREFKVFFHNIRSIPQNLSNLFDVELSNSLKHCDVYGFCETRLTNNIEYLYNLPDYTKVTNSISRLSGGLALYINNIY